MNRTVLVFRGPQHHGPMLRPVEQALQAQGWRVQHYTANTEACFQIALNQELGVGNYLWLPDYIDKARARRMYEAHAKRLRQELASLNVLSMMLPQVIDRIVMHTCEEWTATEQLLRSVRPDRCLSLHEINRWGVMLGYWCMRNKIPLYTLQEGLYYGDPWIYTGHTTYGISLVWGEGTKAKLVAAGCPAEKIQVVGHPDLGRRIEAGRTSVAQWLPELPVHVLKKRVCLLFLSHVHLEGNAKQLLEGLADEWFVVVKPHPLAAVPDLQAIQEAFGQSPEQSMVLPVETPEAVKWRWMARAEVCLVAGCSSVIVECVAAEKKLGLIPTANSAHDYTEEGVGVPCGGMTIQNAIQKIETEWAQYEAATAAWAARELASLDAAEPMATIIAEARYAV